MTKKEMIEQIEGLKRWVKCNFTKKQLERMKKEDVKYIYRGMFHEFAK